MIEALLSARIYILMPVVLIGYSAACLGIGLLILGILVRFTERLNGISSGTILATAFILGEGVLASLWLLLALSGFFIFPIVALLSFIFATGGLYIGRSTLITFKRQVVSIWRELHSDTWGWQFIVGLTVLLCLIWYTSLGRPLSIDGAAFYFAFAKLIAYSHHLIPLPGYEEFTNVGLQGELHFAALILLHSRNAALLFSWTTIIAAGFMLASLGRTVGMGRRGQWLTLSILFSSSAVAMLSGDGKVDLFGVALGLAAYYWAVQIRFNRTKLVLFLTGLFSGFAFVAKLSYIPVMIPGIALLVIWGYGDEFKNKSNWQSYLKSFISGSLVILAGLVLALAPHLIKNGLLFHNPFSPFGVSGGMSWLDQKWFGDAVARRILLTYPFALTYGDYWAQYGNLSPLILAFLPLAFFLPRPRSLLSSPLAVVTLATLAGLAVWMIYRPSVFAPRYILATLLLLALLPARAAEYISYTDFRPRILALGVNIFTSITLISFGLSFLGIVFFPNSIIPSLMGKIDECNRDGIYCSAIEKINKVAQPGERVYLAADQHYWFRGDLLQCLPNKNDQIAGDNAGDQFWLELYKKGFSYLFIDKVTHATILNRLNLVSPPNWVKLTPILNSDLILIYHIHFVNPPTVVAPMICKQQPSSTIWEVTSP